MTGPSVGGRTKLITTVAAALMLVACGQTYLESSTTTVPPDVTTTTQAPVDPSAPVAELLAEIQQLMIHLDERIIDGDDPQAALARIEELWAAAEPTIRQDALDSLYQFEQALDMARTGVARKRPADASKGYKLMQQLAAAYAA